MKGLHYRSGVNPTDTKHSKDNMLTMEMMADETSTSSLIARHEHLPAILLAIQLLPVIQLLSAIPLLIAIMPAIAVPRLPLLFPPDCACGGGAHGAARLVGEGKLVGEGCASASRRRGRCRQVGFSVLAIKAGSRSCHHGASYQGACHQGGCRQGGCRRGEGRRGECRRGGVWCMERWRCDADLGTWRQGGMELWNSGIALQACRRGDTGGMKLWIRAAGVADVVWRYGAPETSCRRAREDLRYLFEQ